MVVKELISSLSSSLKLLTMMRSTIFEQISYSHMIMVKPKGILASCDTLLFENAWKFQTICQDFYDKIPQEYESVWQTIQPVI